MGSMVHFLAKCKNRLYGVVSSCSILDVVWKGRLENDGIDKPQQALDLINVDKARLVEDKIPYEKLTLNTEFSDSEVTYELNREIIKEKKDKQVLLKIKKLKGQVNDLKNHSINSLLSYIHTIRTMDQHSKKMVFKRFEP